MALHDGFFDARYNEDTDEYDRAYEAEDFLTYFDQIVGSGVCIYKNENSFLVRMEDGNAVVSPGYLFITGHWLKNDAEYTVPLTDTGIQAVVAHLNTGDKRIDIETRSVAQSYPDSLVLAIVDPASGSVEDTRYNGDICGVIDAAGSVSTKVEWALNYIDKEIEAKLAQAESDINAQSRKLDLKIAEVQAQIDKIQPPPVGSIKFSASQNVGAEWLRCDGSFVNEQDYPELVAALGKLTPSGDKFQLLSDGEIAPQITNGVLYGGRMWVYSYSTKKLYGVDVEGEEAIKEVLVSSDSPYFSDFVTPSTAYPICLSIVPHKAGSGAMIFLAQRLGSDLSDTSDYSWIKSLLLFQSEFTGEENSLEFSIPFTRTSQGSMTISPGIFLPYVVSTMENGEEKYLCAIGFKNGFHYYIKFGNLSCTYKGYANEYRELLSGTEYQRSAFNIKSKEEAAFVMADGNYYWYVGSIINNTFNHSLDSNKGHIAATSQCALNIVGPSKMIVGFTLSKFPVVPLNEAAPISDVSHGLSLPNAARIFVDAGTYLWGKDIYMIFVGTGIIFSRTLEDNSFGYLDTTSVLGTITQFGYLDYSQDEGTLYLLGQDTSNHVKMAKIVLNTLYDYANDGAWLPLIASDGVPAYIKAYEPDDGGGSGPEYITKKIVVTVDVNFGHWATVLFNGESLIAGTYTRDLHKNGTFTVGLRTIAQSASTSNSVRVYLNGTAVANASTHSAVGTEKTLTLNVSDFLSGDLAITARFV